MTFSRTFPSTPSYRAATLTFADGVLTKTIMGHPTVVATGLSESEAHDVVDSIATYPVCGVSNSLDGALGALDMRRKAAA